MNRRNFLKDTVAFSALGATVPFANLSAEIISGSRPQLKAEIYSFSKLFQFLDFDELAALFKESGLDGIDLTVRKGGHVEPENVEKDLPKAVQAAQKKGLTIPSIVTDINDANDPLTIHVLKTASENGVKYYRLAYYRYDYKKTMPDNLENFRTKLNQLGELNAKYNIHGGYQNHYGSDFGGSPWDIWEVIRNMDKRWIGSFYDVYHGVAEGVQSWTNAMRVLAPYITQRYIKDFYFIANEKGVKINTCELGKGMVNFNQYFRICKELNIDAPFCLHIEYDMFNGEEKTLSHAEKYKIALTAMKRDTDQLKSLMIV